MYGELIPKGGGDPIPLLSKQLKVGRREGCDIVLRFANVSAEHCVLTLEDGYWYVKDLGSRNGLKINGARISGEVRKRLDPGVVLAVAKHEYEVQYAPSDVGALGTAPPSERAEEFPQQSLMERAGLSRRQKPEEPPVNPLGDKRPKGRHKVDE